MYICIIYPLPTVSDVIVVVAFQRISDLLGYKYGRATHELLSLWACPMPDEIAKVSFQTKRDTGVYAVRR